MKMQKVYLAALLTMLAACTKAPQAGDGYVSDPEAVRIDASVGLITRSNPLGTAEEQTKFNKGDKISVTHVSANKYVNYVFDGTSWAPEGEDYLTWQTGGTNTFRIQYPHIGHERDFGEFFKDQSTVEKMTRSDLMQSEDIECTKIPDDRILSATLNRKRSLITVVIAGFGDEFSSEEAKVTDLKLHLWDGGQGDEIITVTPYIRDAQGVAQPEGTAGLKGYSYTAIGRNDCKYSGKAFITMTVAGKSLTVANPADMMVGKHYTYNLTVGKETVKIAGVTVAPWGTGDPIDGTYETETDRYSVWDGTSVEDPWGYGSEGYGTEEYPYVINSAAHLAGFAKLVNEGYDFSGKYIKLNSNIDLNGQPWTPIGGNWLDVNNPGNYFRGHFDGNGKVITNMTVNAIAGANEAGLFGLASNATIRNLILRNGKVSDGIYSSALLIAKGASITVESCKVDGAVKSEGKGVSSGGLIGRGDGESKITNCEVSVDCYGDQYSGGIIGCCEYVDVTIEGCTVRGLVSSGSNYVGGIAGILLDCVLVISDCVSHADVKCNSTMTDSSMGGLVAKISGGTVKDCTVYGNIFCIPCSTGTYTKVGGMFGLVDGVTMSGLKFEGKVNVDKSCSDLDKSKTGAFIGEVQNSITVSGECTYRESGNEDLPAVASNPNGVEINNIKGI